MGGIKDKVAIIGMGCTRFGELWDKSQSDLIIDATKEALEDAGIEMKDIQAAWLGTALGGLLGMRLARALKTEYIPVTHVENLCTTATDAMRQACYAVAAGACEIALVCGVEKLKDSKYLIAGGMEAPDGTKIEPIIPPATGYALAATRYFHQYGLSPAEGKEILARIAVKNHHNGSLNKKAHFQKEITLEQAIKAPIIAYPLGVFDCCGVSDGAAAAIVTTADLAKKFRDDYILVKSIQLVTGAYQRPLQPAGDFVHFEETVQAAKRAYQEAGITNPRKEIDLAMVHDCFTITELIIYEDLGFSPRGKAGEDVKAGTFELDGELPVNTDGGLKCFGHPFGASGLRMIYEVYKQLQGKAEKRQVKDAKIGLTHNIAGTPRDSSVCGISILGRRD
ncbi:MAG: acetyl-CoA acetyltransferase [Deltaproteobacteria bacterium HGW-Deltaproteobacteria-21]|nr:MAG: acetyl-CoA acetyltransferase [Deltaproteobacteria bacterium HGW-Deltaproteobacteria-21]